MNFLCSMHYTVCIIHINKIELQRTNTAWKMCLALCWGRENSRKVIGLIIRPRLKLVGRLYNSLPHSTVDEHDWRVICSSKLQISLQQCSSTGTANVNYTAWSPTWCVNNTHRLCDKLNHREQKPVQSQKNITSEKSALQYYSDDILMTLNRFYTMGRSSVKFRHYLNQILAHLYMVGNHLWRSILSV